MTNKKLPKFTSVEEYVAYFPAKTQGILNKLRALVKEIYPEVTEGISYQIIGFKVDGKYLVYFAGYDEHVGMYPVHEGEFDEDLGLGKYRSGKATIRFSLAEEIPYDLIEKIIKLKLAKIKS